MAHAYRRLLPGTSCSTIQNTSNVRTSPPAPKKKASEPRSDGPSRYPSLDVDEFAPRKRFFRTVESVRDRPPGGSRTPSEGSMSMSRHPSSWKSAPVSTARSQRIASDEGSKNGKMKFVVRTPGPYIEFTSSKVCKILARH